MKLLDLPRELLDLVFDHLLVCCEHPYSTRENPCLNWHTPAHSRQLTPLRLVHSTFTDHFTPVLFAHITSRSPSVRHGNLSNLSLDPNLPSLVHILRLEVCPRDFGRSHLHTIHAYPPADRPAIYFSDLATYLTPILSRFPSLSTLHLTTTYTGLEMAGTSRAQLLHPCFAALVGIVAEAGLERLEECQLGVPYEGGYAGFFTDENGKAKEVVARLSSVGQGRSGAGGLRSASVKLSDWQDNFTIMELPVGEYSAPSLPKRHEIGGKSTA